MVVVCVILCVGCEGVCVCVWYGVVCVCVWCVCVLYVCCGSSPLLQGAGWGMKQVSPSSSTGRALGARLSLAPRVSPQAGLRECWRSPGLGSTQLICQDFYTIVFGCSRALSSLIFCSLDTSFPFRLPGVSRKAGGVLFQVSKSLSTDKKWQTSQLPPHQHPPPGL